ncbi:UNVERIFIED_CONTAM: hypothetical protein Sradi_6948400 [Sesamum radiatum]|uniref:Uncharacterized protein n=1 Tax=Sesamum radiatum TaxID=300843 RepID=A0AAW2JH67_SESRA
MQYTETPSLATALADSKHRRRFLLKRNRLALKLLGGVPNTPRHSPLKQFAKTETLKHSAPHICLLLARRVAPRSRPYISLGKRPRNDFILGGQHPDTSRKFPLKQFCNPQSVRVFAREPFAPLRAGRHPLAARTSPARHSRPSYPRCGL